MSRASAAAAKSERPMTKRDWGALYLAWRLCEQIVLHGHRALDDFIDAMVELRATQPTQDGGYDMTAEATAKGIAQLVHRPAVSEAREEPSAGREDGGREAAPIRTVDELRAQYVYAFTHGGSGKADDAWLRISLRLAALLLADAKLLDEATHALQQPGSSLVLVAPHRDGRRALRFALDNQPVPAPSSAGTPAVSEVEARMRAVLRPSPFDPSRVDELTEAQAVALYRALVREWPQVATAPSPARAAEADDEQNIVALIEICGHLKQMLVPFGASAPNWDSAIATLQRLRAARAPSEASSAPREDGNDA